MAKVAHPDREMRAWVRATIETLKFAPSNERVWVNLTKYDPAEVALAQSLDASTSRAQLKTFLPLMADLFGKLDPRDIQDLDWICDELGITFDENIRKHDAHRLIQRLRLELELSESPDSTPI